MAQGDSAVSVANIALIDLGEAPITALTESNKRATLVNARIDDIRRFVLRTHPWNCAKKQAQLAASTTLPLFRWDNKYPLPDDFIRFYDEDQMTLDMTDWEVMDGCLFTNVQGALNCEYIYDLQDYTRMDPGLIHVIAYNIVAELGLAITQNPSRTQLALATMQGKYEIARFINAQERAPKEWDVDILLRARN